MRVLVIGGTGSFSTRVTQRALERGHGVLVYAPADELARFAPDVVVDSICFDPARADDLVAFGAAGTAAPG
jgi:uncharacterized protein YbjT (DUF2867 family)